MVPSGMLRLMDLVRTDVSEEPSASFIRVVTLMKEARKPQILQVVSWLVSYLGN
jgi:hypothetical protein